MGVSYLFCCGLERVEKLVRVTYLVCCGLERVEGLMGVGSVVSGVSLERTEYVWLLMVTWLHDTGR